MISNYGAGENSLEFLGQQGSQQWIFIGRTDAEAEASIRGQRADSLEKTLMLGKIESRRRRGQQRRRWLDGITNSMDLSLSKRREIVKDRGAWRAVVHLVVKSQTQLGDWTTTTGSGWDPPQRLGKLEHTILASPSSPLQVTSSSLEGACIQVWWPSFYSSHPKNAPLDYRALIGKCSCIHKPQRTVANKETVFNGHRNNL